MVSLKILENCPTPHVYLKIIKDNYGEIIDFEIIHTNLNKNSNEYLIDNLYQTIKDQEHWKDILQETLDKEKASITKYIEDIKNYVIIDLENIEEDYIIIWISTDIEHRKEEVQELEKLRMEFFANLSHELRTPINLIFSSVQLLNVLSESENKEQPFAKCLGIIKQNSYRLSKLVNNLIDSTKISAGHFDFSPQNHDVVSFIEGICMSVAQHAGQKDIEIIFDTDVEEKIIGFDLNQVERIVLNLLSNAIKFSESNGKIFINIYSKEDVVEVKVRDEGIGIPEENLEDVFKMYKQVNNKMTKLSEGSGIGLSLVKSLVEMHGGYVDVKSKLNQGSEFVFALPDIIIDQTFDSFLRFNEEAAKSSSVETIKIEFSDIY